VEKFIIVFKQCPYGSVYPIEAARIIQGLLVMDLDAKAVFIDDGVYALTKNHKPEGINMALVKLTLENLESANVPMYVIRESLAERGINNEELDYNVSVISLEDFSKLLLEADTAISL